MSFIRPVVLRRFSIFDKTNAFRNSINVDDMMNWNDDKMKEIAIKKTKQASDILNSIDREVGDYIDISVQINLGLISITLTKS
jgi:hypothetical protein